MTVYASTFPFKLVVRVWDSFLVEGWKVVYRVMLSLLDHASKDHTDKTFEDILNYFRDFPSTVNGQTIMAGSLRTHWRVNIFRIMYFSGDVKLSARVATAWGMPSRWKMKAWVGRHRRRGVWCLSAIVAGLNGSMLSACATDDDAKINDDINDDDAKISDRSGDDEFQNFLKGWDHYDNNWQG